MADNASETEPATVADAATATAAPESTAAPADSEAGAPTGPAPLSAPAFDYQQEPASDEPVVVRTHTRNFHPHDPATWPIGSRPCPAGPESY